MSENTGTTGVVTALELNDETTSKNFQWNFEGKNYDLFLANRTGGIGMPIADPNDKTRTLGVLAAKFIWQTSEPFLNRLDIETIDKASNHDDWTERENESLMLKNAKCFSELVVAGSTTDYDDLGEAKPPREKSRQEMLNYRKPVQSDLLSLWLGEFHIERYLPEGMTAIDALLSNPTEIYFTCKIGDYNNPRHLLLFKFDVPKDEALSDYQTNTFKRGQNQGGDWRYARDNERRLRFAKKYFLSVQGAMVAPPEREEFDTNDISIVTENDEASLAVFKKNFNPDWFIRLGEELAGCFSLGKK